MRKVLKKLNLKNTRKINLSKKIYSLQRYWGVWKKYLIIELRKKC
jgi:hypothetical protein